MNDKTPQLEDGYMRIAIEVWEALGRYRLSGEEWLVLNCILRKTYGWQKKEDHIPLSQFNKYTGLKPQYVHRALKKLSSKKIITIIKKDDSQVNLYRFNKLFSQWITITKKGYSRPTITNKDTPLSSKKVIAPRLQLSSKKVISIDTKDTNTKDNISVNAFITLFRDINPSYAILYKNKTQRDAVARLIKQYGENKLKAMIEYLPSIVYKKFAPRITTPYELEVKMGQLKQFIAQEKNDPKRGVTQL